MIEHQMFFLVFIAIMVSLCLIGSIYVGCRKYQALHVYKFGEKRDTQTEADAEIDTDRSDYFVEDFQEKKKRRENRLSQVSNYDE